MSTYHAPLIVIDGADGSGKATQTRLALQAVQAAGIRCATIDFPQYKQNHIGSLIGDCLHGAHGDFLSLDPHIVSVLYAADRFESRERILRALRRGTVVILDRYVSANQIHQGGKIRDSRKRRKFLQWLDELEYGVFALPRPDAVIYLDVPPRISAQLLADSGKALDMSERDEEYAIASVRTARYLARTQKGWHRIACAPRGILRSVEDIHAEVLSILSKVLTTRL